MTPGPESVAEQVNRTGLHPIKDGAGRGRHAARWTAWSAYRDATENKTSTGRRRLMVHGAGYPLNDHEHAMASWTEGALAPAFDEPSGLCRCGHDECGAC